MTELTDQINRFQTRLEGLAIQLEQTERLTRMIPAWEAYANQIPGWKDVPFYRMLKHGRFTSHYAN